PVARLPREGWWRSRRAKRNEIEDGEHLRLPAPTSDGEIYVWISKGNTFGRYPIREIVPEQGVVRFDMGGDSRTLSDGDRYWLENRVEWIREPGDWAVAKVEDGYRLTICAKSPDSLADVEVVLGEGSLIAGRKVHDVVIEGLGIYGAARDGVEIMEGERVVVRRCGAWECGRTGISLRAVKQGTVEGCVAWWNGAGISISYSDGVVIRRCDAGYNNVDGLLVTWQSRNVDVVENCSHHHLRWGHPDNVQLYRDVANVRFQRNLFLAGGQTIMMEEAEKLTFEENAFIGCAANMLIFGHGNARDADITRNTFLCPGYSCMSLTARDYRVFENIFMTGHAGIAYSVRGVPGYQADRNLFWASVRATSPRIMATDAGWLGDFEAVQRSTGQDASSHYGDPEFRHAPIAFAVLDSKRLTECTHATVVLRAGAEMFRVGDHVEFDFDGVARVVESVDGDKLTIDPPLDVLPVKSMLVANWGESRSVALDIRPTETSPALHMGKGGETIGAALDVQAYLRGDFDGDGEPDRFPTPFELGIASR
ncbi:MAG: right-handed parallel beta-helix repeat-containing protein, partial [Planctomycetota bacterium]